MENALAPPRSRLETILIEAVFRILAIAGLSIFALRAYGYYRASGDLPVLLLLVSETLTLLLVIFARAPQVRSLAPRAMVFTMAGTYYFLFINLEPGMALVSGWVGETLQALGISMQIASKLYLGRSFGLLPANRGIVTTGPYRVVRHPIYLSYFIAHMGFLLYSFSITNVLVFTALYGFQAARILEEEKVLRADAGYLNYACQVRWRVLPGVF